VKIVSPFRDYYDSIQAYGHDDSRLYVRETRQVTFATNVWPYADEIVQRMDSLPKAYCYAPGFLLFCGEAWPVWREKAAYADDTAVNALQRTRMFPQWQRYYSELRDRPKDVPIRKQREAAIAGFYGDWSEEYLSLAVMRGAHRDFSGIRLGEDVLIGERAPCALLLARSGWWHQSSPTEIFVISNPVLRDLDFHRIREPFSAYQSIETFLGSQLAPADTAPQRVGSDEVIARQKGFDEMSFRTAAPGRKSVNRKANRARKRGQT
jgi:hypothetical protein